MPLPAFKLFPRVWKKLLISFLHALGLICLCWWWQVSGFTLGVEASLAQKCILLKRTLISQEEDTTARFLFIDVSGTKKLVPRVERSGLEMITDRQKIAELLQIVARISNDEYQYIICDVILDKPSPDDAALSKALATCNKVILPYTFEDGELKPPVFKGTSTGFVGYQKSSGIYASELLIKYPLITMEGQKSLPTVVYEKTQQKTVEGFLGLALIDGTLSFNNRIIDFPLRQRHLTDAEGNNKVIPLDDLLNLLKIKGRESFFFQQFMANKLIVIGDFEYDKHNTVVGEVPGSLILADVYLSMLTGEEKITWYLVLYYIVAFTFLSWLLLFPTWRIKRFHDWCEKYQLGIILGDLALYSVLLLVIVFLAFLFSDVFLNAGIVWGYILIMSIIHALPKINKQEEEKINSKENKQTV